MALNINIGSIWTMITGTVLAVAYMFTSFVTSDANILADASQDVVNAARYKAIDTYHATLAEDRDEFRTSIYYGQYYSLLSDYNTAILAGQAAYAEELSRQMERIRAKICANDPQWERCDNE